jgi:hypothetical protein
MIILENKEVIEMLKKEGFKKDENQKAYPGVPSVRYINGDDSFSLARGRIHTDSKRVETLIKNSNINYKEYILDDDGKLKEV